MKQQEQVKPKRLWIFRLILLCIPLFFFLLLEMGLRLVGYGKVYPLFIDTPDSPHYLLGRPDIIKRYFPENATVPTVTLETNFFLKQKPADGIRIFVQGGSTAAGFPYGLGASPAGMLDQRLKQTFPDKQVEVVNTAMSAVNSYSLLDFTGEIIEQQPDAVLIYAGHNEFLGILGVGSSYTAASSHGTNLLFLKLKELRTFQLMQNIFASSTEKEQPASGDLRQKRTFMAKVAKHKDIPANSDMYHAGLEQFEQNLGLILMAYQKAGIPVYVSTIASNLKDQPPFASHPINDQVKGQMKIIWEQARVKDKHKAVRNKLEQLIADSSLEDNAELHYFAGQLYLKLGDNAKALQHFTQAKDTDLLRFRAPEAINQIIRDQAMLYDARLVDYHGNLSKSSESGIIGSQFMLEHLHPNVQGYFILADSFYQALKQDGKFASWDTAIETNLAWKRRPILPAEEYFGFSKILQLKTDYPFSKTPKKLTLPKPSDWQQEIGLKHFKKELDWLGLVTESYRGYVKDRNIPMIIKTAQILADAMPYNHQANFEYGRLLVQDGRKQEAVIYFQRAVREVPDNQNYRKALKKVASSEIKANEIQARQ